MEIVLTDKQLYYFLVRRFTPTELDGLINYVNLLTTSGWDTEDSIYHAVGEFLNDKKLSDIDYHGNDESYMRSFLKYETPLVAYVKHILSNPPS
jgi:hypothetical protein